MRITLIIIHIIICSVVLSGIIKAQDTRTKFDTWTDIATIYGFSSNFRYDGDYGIRHLLSSRNFTQIYLRPSVRYRFEPWLMVHGGFAWFQSFFTNNENYLEMRPWVGLRILWPRIDGWVVSNYLRFEYRISRFTSESNWNRQVRGRFQVQVTTPDFRIGDIEKFYALFFVEPFQNIDSHGEQFFADRLRINFGFGNRLSNSFRVELNLMFQKGRISTETGSRLNIDDYILRLRMFYVLN